MWGTVEARWTPSTARSEVWIHMRGGKWWLLPASGILVGVMRGDWVWPSRAVVGVFHSRYRWGW